MNRTTWTSEQLIIKSKNRDGINKTKVKIADSPSNQYIKFSSQLYCPESLHNIHFSTYLRSVALYLDNLWIDMFSIVVCYNSIQVFMTTLP